jgi:hypothetical protein
MNAHSSPLQDCSALGDGLRRAVLHSYSFYGKKEIFARFLKQTGLVYRLRLVYSIIRQRSNISARFGQTLSIKSSTGRAYLYV